jgi:threonine/homoserine/homoserine lactone efflux protein
MTLEFLLVATLIELTPGPNMLVLATLAARDGRAAGLSAVAGVTCGLGVYLLAAAAGLGVVITQAPGLLIGLRAAGVAYLVWLAYEAWAPEKENSPAAMTGQAETRGRHFWRGLWANLLNAKAAVFYIVLLPRFMDPAQPAWREALVLGAIHLLIAIGIHLAIVLGASAFQARLAPFTERPAVRAAFAMALLGSAAWLALTG